jgi:hypothetical protein
MSVIELRKLPPVEKLKIIGTLWSDLVSDEDSFPQLPWHEAELKVIEDKFETGNIEILDWQQAKRELRSQFE